MSQVILNSASDLNTTDVMDALYKGTFEVKTPTGEYSVAISDESLNDLRTSDELHSMFYVPKECRYNVGQDDDAENDIRHAISTELNTRLAKRYPSMCDYEKGGYYTCDDYEFENGNQNPLYLEDSVEDIYQQLQKELKDHVKHTMIVPVQAYIHSGIMLSLGSFSCPFDSGTIGFMAMTSQQLKDMGIKTTKTDYLTTKDKALITKFFEDEIKLLNAGLSNEALLVAHADEDGCCYQVMLDDLEEHLFH